MQGRMQLLHGVAPGSKEAGQLGGVGGVCVQHYDGVWQYICVLLYCFIYAFQNECPAFHTPITPFASAALRDTTPPQTFTGLPHKLYTNCSCTHMTYSNDNLAALTLDSMRHTPSVFAFLSEILIHTLGEASIPYRLNVFCC
jgi:hypothetical protein